MGAWLFKLIGGWWYNGKDSDGQPIKFSSWIAKRIWIVGMILMVLFATNIYGKIMDHFFPPPAQNNIGQGGTQIIYQDKQDVAGLSCNMWRGYIRVGIKK